MKLILLILLSICLVGCTARCIQFKETDDGVLIQSHGKLFGIPYGLPSGHYAYTKNLELKQATADFKKEWKLFDFNLSKLVDQ